MIQALAYQPLLNWVSVDFILVHVLCVYYGDVNYIYHRF